MIKSYMFVFVSVPKKKKCHYYGTFGYFFVSDTKKYLLLPPNMHGKTGNLPRWEFFEVPYIDF